MTNLKGLSVPGGGWLSAAVGPRRCFLDRGRRTRRGFFARRGFLARRGFSVRLLFTAIFFLYLCIIYYMFFFIY
jgi:hypothetical protein